MDPGRWPDGVLWFNEVQMMVDLDGACSFGAKVGM